MATLRARRRAHNKRIGHREWPVSYFWLDSNPYLNAPPERVSGAEAYQLMTGEIGTFTGVTFITTPPII